MPTDGVDATQAMWQRRASSLDASAVTSARENYRASISAGAGQNFEKQRRPTIPEIEERIKGGTVPQVNGEFEALQVAKEGGWEIEALMLEMEALDRASGRKKSIFDLHFNDPKHFTWLLVIFASMGGLLSGLDQSLISGANLYLPKDLGLNVRQNSLVNSGMPLGRWIAWAR